MIYDLLASYYDTLVQDEQAVLDWLAWMKPYLEQPDLLELACGSGEITRHLADLNYEVTALDLSAKMIEQARQKPSRRPIAYQVADMRDLKDFPVYSAILCLCDSINYLSAQEMPAFFHEVSAHLKPGGYFLFDTHSLDRLKEFADEYNEVGEFADGTQYQWSIMSEDETIYQDFAFYRPDGQMIQEHHLQTVFDPEQLEEWLDPYFEIIRLDTDFVEEGIQPGEKYFYICQKKEST